MAIASAVLDHLVQSVNCKTLFITHYPLIATDLERRYPAKVQNLHMGFTEETGIDGVTSLTFLYRLTSGVSTGSFGIECARLAGLPETLLETASTRAAAMHTMILQRNLVNRSVDSTRWNVIMLTTIMIFRSRKLIKLLNDSMQSGPTEAKVHIRDMRIALSCTSNTVS